jgi:ribonuclease HII
MAVGVEMDEFHVKIISVKKRYVIGIDEVGRGALAGPVVVAAVAVPTKLRIKNAELRVKGIKNSEFLILNSKLAKLKDSKKLSSKQREIWFDYIKNNSKIFYAVSSVSPKIVDKINISRAANLAAGRALKKLIFINKLPFSKISVFLDGGLYLGISGFSKLKQKTIIKGDEKIPVISLASIAAKVTRDKRMREKCGKYPGYDFRAHKGYGTKMHFGEIRKNGIRGIHRLTFLGKAGI